MSESIDSDSKRHVTVGHHEHIERQDHVSKQEYKFTQEHIEIQDQVEKFLGIYRDNEKMLKGTQCEIWYRVLNYVKDGFPDLVKKILPDFIASLQEHGVIN